MDEPITISSSDSESDIDFEFGGNDDAFSTHERAEGYGEHSAKDSFSQNAAGSFMRTFHPKIPSQSLRIDDHHYPVNHANHAGFPSAAQRKFSSSQRQKHPVEQQDKRALPFSFHPSSSYSSPNNFKDDERIRIHQINGSGKPYPFAGPSSAANGKSHEKHYADNDAAMLDKNGLGSFPPWMRVMPGSSGRYASSVDPVDPFRTADERIGGTDESSVFQEVMQDLNQPKQEVDIPDGLLSVPLLRHQKIALAWMRQKEARPFCVGGILADDQGLGKTISTIALIQMERHSEKNSKPAAKAEALNLDDDDDEVAILDDVKAGEDIIRSSSKEASPIQASSNQRPAAGTLVVCPATVLRQWERELQEKVTKEAKLDVLVYHGGSRTKDPSKLAKYDVVLTTYAIVSNEVPKQPLVDEDDAEQKTMEKYGLSAEFSLNQKRKKPSSASKKGKKGRKGPDSCFLDSNCGTLAKVRWLRVVLDEAQMIKNHRTQMARACCGLRAKKRWCLSGTPIQNAIDELFSYFRFLKYDPYSSYKAFCEGIKIPINRDSKSGYQKLQVVLRTVMLRRTKGTSINGKPIINLPPKHIQMISVDFTLEERDFYNKLESESRTQFKAYADAGTVGANYANILLMLLRLRQACDHPHLVSGFGSDSVSGSSSIQILKQLPKDELMNLFYRLEFSPICQICNDPPEDAVVAMCGHVFCNQCVLDHLSVDDNTSCPSKGCKKQLRSDAIFSKATLRACLADSSESSLPAGDPHDKGLSVESNEYISSKVRTALEILNSLDNLTPSATATPCIVLDDPAGDDVSAIPTAETNAFKSGPSVHVRTEVLQRGPHEGRQKAIVFSQWTRMLDLMESSLKQSGLVYRRLDGTMSLPARDKAVREFSFDPEVTVMLMSLKAGNLGLNLVAACHVILLDLWWNPTTEDQAIDRAHRIGQTRAVTVSRLTVKDTVEDRILALQEEKRKMVASAFGEENSGVSAARLTPQDLRFLFMGA